MHMEWGCSSMPAGIGSHPLLPPTHTHMPGGSVDLGECELIS